MRYCKGTITDVRQCSGCAEVIVAGEAPGSFAIDNLCFGMIVDCEGPTLTGRAVEYCDGHMRFLDEPEHEEIPDAEPALSLFPKLAHASTTAH